MNNDTAGAAFSMLVAAIGLMLLLLAITTSAPAGTICLTYKEARHLWPKQYLSWYSRDHCWSNRRGGPPTKLHIDPIDEKKPRLGGVKVVRPDEYNEMDAALDRDLFFDAEPFPFWQMVMNLDRYRFHPWHERIGNAFVR